MSIKISALQIENVKRIMAFQLKPSENGLTIIGGKNGQGKTSVLDAIAWALGGAKRAPSNAKNEKANGDPHIELELSNGLRAVRKGKNSALTVVDPSGQRSGQTLLDSFVEEFALDVPKFLAANNREKAQILLKILGIGDQLKALDEAEQQTYNERHAIGKIAESKKKHAEELPEYPDAPDEAISVSALIKAQQAILVKNGDNHRKRERKASIEAELAQVRTKLEELQARQTQLVADLADANKNAAQLEDENTAELEAQINNAESINAQVAANNAKVQAQDEAETYGRQYDEKTVEIESIRKQRLEMLEGANLPLPGLSVQDSELLYQGKAWDCMSGADQLRVAVAIVRQLKPECGFVLLDKLEQMDIDTLQEFGAWLEQEDLQVIATRVSTGEECTVVIENGLPSGMSYADVVTGIVRDSESNNKKEYNW